MSLPTWWFYWAELALARKFPKTEFKWILIWSSATLVVLGTFVSDPRTNQLSVMLLGFVGSAYMGYVNLRFGAPYLFDFVLPFPYISMLCAALAASTGSDIYEFELLGGIVYASLLIAQYWRTKKVGKLERLRAIRSRGEDKVQGLEFEARGRMRPVARVGSWAEILA